MLIPLTSLSVNRLNATLKQRLKSLCKPKRYVKNA
ncbi:hypothetical protein YGAWVPHU_CDS0137 [Salmonella phage SeKF_13]